MPQRVYRILRRLSELGIVSGNRRHKDLHGPPAHTSVELIDFGWSLLLSPAARALPAAAVVLLESIGFIVISHWRGQRSDRSRVGRTRAASHPDRDASLEALRRLLQGEVNRRRVRNVVQARSFSEMLAQSILRYQNRAIEAAQVIEELIGLAQEIREADARGE